MNPILVILQRQYSTIQTELTRYRNNPYDPERVHDLRVSIRTLRGLFKFLKRALSPTSFATIDGFLSQAAKIFSSLRDIDVLIIKSSEFAYAHPQESNNYRQLFHDLHVERAQKMRSSITKTTIKKLTDYLARVKKQLDVLNFNKDIDWSIYISDELKRRKNKLFKLYTDLDFQDYSRVHQIRKKAKTLRYAADYFAEVTSKNTQKIHKKAKQIQKKCGIITDAHVNYELLQYLATQTKSNDVKKILLRIAQTQHDIFASTKKDV